ncbi:ADP-ribosylglycohydrolase family protein [Pseudaeromonas sp. ZJS20]|uniref:ADP-ribosylglycohydrolase family protein n=1 Tax=Pseudaeromonas aegiceratis TaxID=3153928 RepID=UPI00390CD2E7
MSRTLNDKAMGAFAGLAIGDALGTTLEFMPRDQYEPLQDIIGGGPFQLRAGEWTDDTSMALCLADSLLCCRQHNPIDQLERYSRWREEGENSVNGRCFDIGRTVSKALREFKGSSSPYPGGQDHYSAGNGSLMRLAPLVLFYSTHVSTRDTASAIVHLLEMSAFSSMTTHRHPLAVSACKVMALFMDHALGLTNSSCQQTDKSAIISFSAEETARLGALPIEIKDIVQGSYRHKSRYDIASSGYVVDSLEAALWAFWHGQTFEEGALLAANLGGDADTIAAIYGQLAGAYYGLDGIPSSWVNKLAWHERIVDLAQQLIFPAATRLPQEEDVRNLLDQMQAATDQNAEMQATRLLSAVYACGIIQVDYLEHPVVRAMALAEQHEWVNNSTKWELEDCCYLLTALVRAARFSSYSGVDGIADELTGGRISVILMRMASIIGHSGCHFPLTLGECDD